ncbi:MAG: UDP-N-acetylmuramate dehydrogenase [Candidatus Omnitrophica bacterium]|nr:UDP-N-acetylmuramate dehydrogenase [Candidatus Omnitrophota bacterium]
MCLGAGDITQTAEELGERLRRLSKDGLEPRKESGGDARLIKRSHLLFGAVRGRVLLEEPLARHTTLKIGGPAQVWIEPQDLEDLKQVLALAGKESLPVTIFGFGSNLLVPDEGIRGVVVCLASSYFREIRPEEGGILARAGAPNALFIQYALEQGFGGFEFLSGIPGNIGGSVAMNAGSHGESIDSLVRRVRVMSFNGEERWLERSEVPFRYRSSGIREAVIVEALFSLPRIDRRKVREKLEEYREHRSKTQDLQHPSAGCMFKNPGIPGSSSGRLIEEAGLKGKRIGHAQISTKHGNFIVNCGGATAKDVLLLMEEARKAVKEKFDIELETEVKVL